MKEKEETKKKKAVTKKDTSSKKEVKEKKVPKKEKTPAKEKKVAAKKTEKAEAVKEKKVIAKKAEKAEAVKEKKIVAKKAEKAEAVKEKKVVAKKTEKAEAVKEKKVIAKKVEKAEAVKEKKEAKKEEKIAIAKENKVEAIKTEMIVNDTKKESSVLLDDKSGKTLKTLSKIINIFAKIGRVLLMIAVPFLILTMIAIPFLMKNFEVNGNIIKIFDASVIVNEKDISIKLGDNVYTSKDDYKELSVLTGFLQNNSKRDIIVISEVSLAFTAGILIISIYLLIYVEKLFANIYHGKTPFTNENTNYIRRIGQMMIVCAIIAFVFEGMAGSFFPRIKIANYRTYGILEILIVYAVYYIFKYATNMQKESDTKIYK